jgi:hypothetical protein
MKPRNASRQLNLTLLVAVLGAVSMGAGASAPKTVSKTQQPVGTPHKASSFAPHPTKRRVFGAPIQPPIVSPPAPPKQ